MVVHNAAALTVAVPRRSKTLAGVTSTSKQRTSSVENGSHKDMEVVQEHVSAGCNRVVGALDWGRNGLVAYAAHNLVVLYDAEVRLLSSPIAAKRCSPVHV